MFGSCVLNKGIFLFIFLLAPVIGWAQAQQATVMMEGALIYQDSDFDAPVITTVKRGAVYSISKGKKGAFYKIRLKPGTVGWIADSDVKLGVVKIAPPATPKQEAVEQRKKKSYVEARYRGLSLDYIHYTEDTVGGEQSEFVPFLGVKFYGNDTMWQGEIYTEANFLVSPSAPKYYEEITKKTASGFIFMANFLFQTATPRGKNAMTFYGFGPMFKYSHINLQVPDGTRTLNYTAEDMTVGAIFNFGLGARFGRFSLRADAKYYWEQKSYYGFGTSLGLDF